MKYLKVSKINSNKIQSLSQANEKNYKDIVVPLVSQIIDQLKSQRVTDVKLYLVGVTSKFPYPVLYDTDCEYRMVLFYSGI